MESRGLILLLSAMLSMAAVVGCATASEQMPADERGALDEQWLVSRSDDELTEASLQVQAEIVEIREDCAETWHDIVTLEDEYENAHPECRDRFAADVREKRLNARALGERYDRAISIVRQLTAEISRRRNGGESGGVEQVRVSSGAPGP